MRGQNWKESNKYQRHKHFNNIKAKQKSELYKHNTKQSNQKSTQGPKTVANGLAFLNMFSIYNK